MFTQLMECAENTKVEVMNGEANSKLLAKAFSTRLKQKTIFRTLVRHC